MNEIKYIIIKDSQGRLRHFNSEHLHHSQIAEHNGFNGNDIIEEGLFLDGRLFILECNNQAHLIKHKNNYIGNNLNLRNDLRLQAFLKGRELESQYYYSIKPISQDVEYKTLKGGD